MYDEYFNIGRRIINKVRFADDVAVVSVAITQEEL